MPITHIHQVPKVNKARCCTSKRGATRRFNQDWNVLKGEERESRKLKRKDCGKREGTGDFWYIDTYRIEMTLEAEDIFKLE
jgi:hypothetical protein